MPLHIIRNDITKVQCDAIVNAANSTLLGGGGVDGAIHRAAGPELLAECRTLGGCATGDAKITKGYRLPSHFVIHTVGPIWEGGNQGEEALLISCYQRSLELAVENGCRSVAFPLISSGVYGYPKAAAFQTAVSTITDFLRFHDLTVYIVLFGRTSVDSGSRLYSDIQSFIVDHYADVRRDYSRRAEDSAPYFASSEKSCVSFDAYPEETVHALRRQKSKKVMSSPLQASRRNTELADMLAELDESFSQALFRLIDARGLTDVQCYKRAGISRKLFSKIRSDELYKPSKMTALAFAIALELTYEETNALLAKAGFVLSASSKFDLIITFFIQNNNYDFFAINEALYQFDQPIFKLDNA